MKKIAILSILSFLLCTTSSAQAKASFHLTTSNAQAKVAIYSFGDAGTEEYEHFAFWIRDGKRAEIFYVYGKDKKLSKVTYLTKDILRGDSCFKLKFPNNSIFHVIPKGLNLIVTDSSQENVKIFSWEYQGSKNEGGALCNLCAENEKKL
jgi:hypothetical protein